MKVSARYERLARSKKAESGLPPLGFTNRNGLVALFSCRLLSSAVVDCSEASEAKPENCKRAGFGDRSLGTCTEGQHWRAVAEVKVPAVCFENRKSIRGARGSNGSQRTGQIVRIERTVCKKYAAEEKLVRESQRAVAIIHGDECRAGYVKYRPTVQ